MPATDYAACPESPASEPLAADHRVRASDGVEIDASTRIILAAEGRELKVVEYRPGKYCALIPRDCVPLYGAVRYQRLANGDFRPNLLTWSRYIRSGSAGLRDLGLDLPRNTIIRLWRNGFINCLQPAPQTILIDIPSLIRHLEDCSDPYYWTSARKAQYAQDVY